MKLKLLFFLSKFSYKFLFLVNSKFCIITPYTKYIINSRMKLSEEITYTKKFAEIACFKDHIAIGIIALQL